MTISIVANHAARVATNVVAQPMSAGASVRSTKPLAGALLGLSVEPTTHGLFVGVDINLVAALLAPDAQQKMRLRGTAKRCRPGLAFKSFPSHFHSRLNYHPRLKSKLGSCLPALLADTRPPNVELNRTENTSGNVCCCDNRTPERVLDPSL
jgi:hypothetical protein